MGAAVGVAAVIGVIFVITLPITIIAEKIAKRGEWDAEHNFTEDPYRRAAAVSETKPKIKKCNCMPACSHKFCGCPAHCEEQERASLYAAGFSARRAD